MNTRREMALALLGLPLVTRAVTSEVQQASEPKLKPEAQPKQKSEPKPVPPPFSEAAASIISYTLYAEARGEPFEGMKAVASVIQTRAMRANISMAEVCLQDQQFSCWNGLKAVPDFYHTGAGIEFDDLQARSQCFALTWVLMDMLMDKKTPWYHFTHFYNPDKATPDWAFELKGTRTIGRQVFGYID